MFPSLSVHLSKANSSTCPVAPVLSHFLKAIVLAIVPSLSLLSVTSLLSQIIITTQTSQLTKLKKKNKSLNLLYPFTFCIISLFPFTVKILKLLSETLSPNLFSHSFLKYFNSSLKITLIKISNNICIVKFNNQLSWKGFLYVFFYAMYSKQLEYSLVYGEW